MREFYKIRVEQCEAAGTLCQSSASFESLLRCPILLRFPSPLLRDLLRELSLDFGHERAFIVSV
jgi:hypothetical protein